MGGLASGIALTYWLGPKMEILPLGEYQSFLTDGRPWASVKRGVALSAVAVVGLAVLAAYTFR